MEDQKSINFTIVPDQGEDVPRVYSNFCSIQNSPFDFTLTFCEMQPVGEKELKAAFWGNFVRWVMRRDATLALLGVPRSQRQQIDAAYAGGIAHLS